MKKGGIFNNIPHFVKTRLRVDFLQYGFVVYNNKITNCKREVIPNTPDSMIPMYGYKKVHPSLISKLMT